MSDPLVSPDGAKPTETLLGRMEITFDPTTHQVICSTNIPSKLLCYGVLEAVRQLIEQERPKPTIFGAPASVMHILKERMRR